MSDEDISERENGSDEDQEDAGEAGPSSVKPTIQQRILTVLKRAVRGRRPTWLQPFESLTNEKAIADKLTHYSAEELRELEYDLAKREALLGIKPGGAKERHKLLSNWASKHTQRITTRKTPVKTYFHSDDSANGDTDEADEHGDGGEAGPSDARKRRRTAAQEDKEGGDEEEEEEEGAQQEAAEEEGPQDKQAAPVHRRRGRKPKKRPSAEQQQQQEVAEEEVPVKRGPGRPPKNGRKQLREAGNPGARKVVKRDEQLYQTIRTAIADGIQDAWQYIQASLRGARRRRRRG